MTITSRQFAAVSAFTAVVSEPAAAYLGPGVGLTGVGAFLALVAAIVVAFIGFLWFPLRRLLRRRREKLTRDSASPDA